MSSCSFVVLWCFYNKRSHSHKLFLIVPLISIFDILVVFAPLFFQGLFLYISEHIPIVLLYVLDN